MYRNLKYNILKRQNVRKYFQYSPKLHTSFNNNNKKKIVAGNYYST